MARKNSGRTDGPKNDHGWLGWTNGPMYGWKDGISAPERTEEQTDGQTENLMPPSPKGGGIKT